MSFLLKYRHVLLGRWVILQIQHTFSERFSEKLTRTLYSCLILVLLPLVILSLYVKAKKRSPAYFQRKRERLGILPQPKQKGGLLFHCVSVGEVVAAAAVIKRIQATRPELPITITTTTPTGSDQVLSIFGDSVNHCYLPYDFPFFVSRLLANYQPEKVIITEVELWPNLIHACWKKQIATFILNARLTESSAKSYQKLGILFRPMLMKIDGICAQSQRDYDNYKMLCPDLTQVHLTGNLKFDQQLQDKDIQTTEELQRNFFNEQRPVIIAASTHAPEEQVMIDACKLIWKNRPDTLLLLVPRHPQRFDKVSELCEENKLNVQKMSEKQPISPNTQVFIADQMGMLKSLYGLANMAFVGGSIADKGGHNALEAALQSIPVIMGPHIYNNPGICEALMEVGALVIREDAQSIAEEFTQWLEHPEQTQQQGRAGHAVIENNSGALQKQLEVLGLYH